VGTAEMGCFSQRLRVWPTSPLRWRRLIKALGSAQLDGADDEPLAGEGRQRDDLDAFTTRIRPHRIQKEAHLHQFTIARQDFFNRLK